MKRVVTMMLVLGAVGLVQAAAGATSDPGGLFKEPRGIDVDSQDRVIVAYAGSHVVAVFGPDGELQRLLGRLDTPGAAAGRFDEPSGITVDVADSIYVADTNNDRICVFDYEGRFLRAIGEVDNLLLGDECRADELVPLKVHVVALAQRSGAGPTDRAAY